MLLRSISISAITAGGTVLSLVFQVAIAYHLGASQQAAALMYGMSIPATIAALGSGALSYLAIPRLSKAASEGQYELALSGLIYTTALSGALAAICGGALSRLISPPASTFFSEGYASAIYVVSAVSWLSVPFAWLMALTVAHMHITERFHSAAVCQSLPTAAALVACLTWNMHHSILWIASGLLLGYIAAFLAFSPKRYTTIGCSRMASTFIEIAPSSLSAAAALTLFTIYPASDAFWGAKSDPSFITIYAYGQRIIVGVTGLVISGAMTILFPIYAKQASSGRESELCISTYLTTRIVMSCVAGLGLILLSTREYVINVVLVRGAFSLFDGARLEAVLPLYVAGMIPMSACGFLFKALFAMHDHTGTSVIGFAGGAFYFLLSGIFSNILGIYGVALAYCIVWWLALIACGHRLSFQSKISTNWTAAGTFIARLSLCVLPSYFICRSVARYVADRLLVSSPSVVVIGGAVGTVVYILMLYLVPPFRGMRNLLTFRRRAAM